MKPKDISRYIRKPSRIYSAINHLPARFNYSDLRERVIEHMGKHTAGFSRQIAEVDAQHPHLINTQIFNELLHTKAHYKTVIEALVLLAEKCPKCVNIATMRRLVALGPHALSYAQTSLEKENIEALVFCNASPLKEIYPIGQTDTRYSAVSHNSTRSFKYKGAVKSKEKLTAENVDKQWFSKFFKKNNTDIFALWPDIFIDFRQKEQLNESDKSRIASRVYQTIAKTLVIDKSHTFAHGVQSMMSLVKKNLPHKWAAIESITTSDDLKKFIDTLATENPTYPEYQSYQHVFPQAMQVVAKILDDLPLGTQSGAHDVFWQDLHQSVLYPAFWAEFLRNCAIGEMEVVAQELRRALCPAVVLGLNPYPKYRMSVDPHAQHSISYLPDIPDIYISSQLMQLNSMINLDKSELWFYPSTGAGKVLLETVPGLATATLFAKFLGDSDPKCGNILVACNHDWSKKYRVIDIDSDNCFDRMRGNPTQSALFDNPTELLLNPMTEDKYYWNYFFLRYQGQEGPSKERQAMETIAQTEQCWRENVATAFNLAFTPPEVYATFVDQYLSKNNPYVGLEQPSGAGIYQRVMMQIEKEQHALYQAFENQPQLLESLMSLDKSRMEDNIFVRYQQLVLQWEKFRFYKKHDLSQTELYAENPYVLEDFLTDFMAKQIKKSPPEFKQKVQQLFEAWENTPSHLSERDRLSALQERVAVRLGLSYQTRLDTSSKSSDETQVRVYDQPPFYSESQRTSSDSESSSHIHIIGHGVKVLPQMLVLSHDNGDNKYSLKQSSDRQRHP